MWCTQGTVPPLTYILLIGQSVVRINSGELGAARAGEVCKIKVRLEEITYLLSEPPLLYSPNRAGPKAG